MKFIEFHSVPCSISAGPVARCVGLWWIAIEWPNCASGAVGSIFQDSSVSSTQFPAQSMLNRRREMLDCGGFACWICVGYVSDLCARIILGWLQISYVNLQPPPSTVVVTVVVLLQYISFYNDFNAFSIDV